MGDGRSVTLGLNRIGYEDPVGPGGDRLPVMLVHGSSVHRAIWDPVVETLCDRFRPISFDHPGHGQSSLPASTSADALTEILEGLYAELGIARSALIGFSLGGAVAQQFHARHPDRIAALGLISTAPNFGLPDELVARWNADPAGYAEDELSLSLAPMASAAARAQVTALRSGVSAEGQAADLTACASWNNPAGLDGIACPLLVMTASHDIPGLKDQAAQWAREFAGSRLVEIANAGHFMLIEQPEASADAILAWLISLDLSP
jgi:3-oxoadipate enol-lactonase/4-carboxymuconolactone decarboxylase